jgi:polyhydroxybutyrate depolymerase
LTGVGAGVAGAAGGSLDTRRASWLMRGGMVTQWMLALAVAVPLAAAAADPVPPRPSQGCAREHIEHGRRLVGALDVGGVKREYVLDVPDSVRARTPAPLLLDFHGWGHSGAGVWRISAFRELATTAGFVTVYPEGLPVQLRLGGTAQSLPGWEMFTVAGNRDLAFVRALLDDLERRYCIDRARVFSTGFSNGGFFSALLGCALSDRIAAVAPVSGGPLRVDCAPARGVPILIQHGRQDSLIPIDRARAARDDWLKVNQCAAATKQADGASCERWTACRAGAVVEYCEGDYAHTWPPDASARVWTFLLAHPLP